MGTWEIHGPLTPEQVSAAKEAHDWIEKYLGSQLGSPPPLSRLFLHREAHQFKTRLWDPGSKFNWHVDRSSLEVNNKNPFLGSNLPKGWEEEGFRFTPLELVPDPACENAYPEPEIYQEKLHPYQIWLQQREIFSPREDYAREGKIRQEFP